MLLARRGKVLYVANANRNTVSVFDAEAGKAVEVIGTAIDPRAPSGSTPSSLALSPDESVLFVANANTNDLAVVNVKEPRREHAAGVHPDRLVSDLGPGRARRQDALRRQRQGGDLEGQPRGPEPAGRAARTRPASTSPGCSRGRSRSSRCPARRRWPRYSKTVYECSPLKPGDPTAVTGPKPGAGNPIPARVGDPSPITHCVYIIKENRTYDQVFGDLPEGNGEPHLCLFPEDVTPNHHALAREFVLLDNFYVDGEVSADGHEWSMGAYATDYVEKTWPLGYRGDRRVPYPAEGNKQVYAIARPAGGYLWDKAAEKGVSYRSYGEFIKNGKTPDDPATTNVEALKGHFDPRFRSYDLDYPDAKRADRFLEELAGFEKAGEMPRLIILRLPNDHTSGTTPGKPTPTAYVADNDLALGRVVEGLSKSRFWKQMAIFVVEDDAQNGSDHVDAHRTVALAISPYIQPQGGRLDDVQHLVDAPDDRADPRPGADEPVRRRRPADGERLHRHARPHPLRRTARPASTSTPRTPPTAWGAEQSKRLNLEIEDRADDLVFNEIIWKAVKGPDSPMPPPVRVGVRHPAEVSAECFGECWVLGAEC